MLKRKSELVPLLIAVLLLTSAFSIVAPGQGNSNESYVIVVAPQEEPDWQPVINRLLYYHPGAIVLTLPENLQHTVMEAERQFRFLLMDGSLKAYLVYAYYFWGLRSIPVPPGYLRSGDIQEMEAIKYLDSKKAEIYRLFYKWFGDELGYQPHFVAMVGDTKTRRSDWVSALGMATWWDPSLPYPADAWPSSINAGQVPVGYLPFVVDEVLAWYGYAVGRIAGLTIDDAVALVDRAGDYNEWASGHQAQAGTFVASFTVGVSDYYSQLPTVLSDAGFATCWFAPEDPIAKFDDVKTALQAGVGYWHLTCHGNFMTGMGGPGNGLITFPYSQSDYYDIMIGPGWSDIIWDFINNDNLESKTTATGVPTIPLFDHTVVRVSSCMTGSSEMPLQFVQRGAVAVVMGLPSQEVCECDGNAAYYYNALTHTNPATDKQFTLGEAMAYANDHTHPLHYFYKASGGMTYWNSMYLIGDPALTPYVPDVGGYPAPLDPQGNNPGSLKSEDLVVPVAFEGPDGTIIVRNIGKSETGSMPHGRQFPK
jgi:hypothetical protein